MSLPHLTISEHAFTFRDTKPVLRRLILLLGTVVCIALLELAHLPAAVLLGSMVAAIILAANEGVVSVPSRLFFGAQGFVGCLVARSISPNILLVIVHQWPVFLFGITAVIVFSTFLGIVLTRFNVLPGTTAIWGSAPGAATVMMLMAEAFGGDIRLVAFMQFLRVVFVALVASLVARLWVHTGNAVLPSIIWFPPLQPASLCATIALAVGGAVIGTRLKIPAGALLVPLFAGIVLSGNHLMTITLPQWLLAISYTIAGWTIGMRFTREIVRYAAHAFWRVCASILTLLAACGVLAYLLHRFAGVDPLTAYLATSPGGADSIAIIAASTKVDLPFIMAMQTSRFLIVLLIGPSLARFVGHHFVKNTVKA